MIAGAAFLFALSTDHPEQGTSQYLGHELRMGTEAQSSATPGIPQQSAQVQTVQTEKPIAQEPISTVHITVIDPDGSHSFDVQLNAGDDLCANLVQAKAERKIQSLQIDDTYLETFGSLYVREINGYSNNWTVEVNGVKPEGCSLHHPKTGDQIIWRFGV